MARNYAQIITAIWRNEDFVALTHEEQWMYLLLNTQPDITAAGVLPLAIKRWSGRAQGMTVAVINRLLDRLADRRFIIIDRDTDEVLVRSFIRWDNGHANPKRQPAIRDAIDLVESRRIVSALSAEMDRIAMPIAYRGQAAVVAVTSTTEPVNDAHPEASPQVDSLSNGYPNTIDRLSDTDGSSGRRVPQPTTPNPQPKTPTVNAARRPGADVLPGTEEAIADADALHITSVNRMSRDKHFAEFWAAYPRKVGKQGARKHWDTKVRAGTDPGEITAGAIRAAAHWNARQTPIDKIPHPQTWINRGSWEDELPAVDAVAVRGGFDARAAEFDNLRDGIRAARTDPAASLIQPTRPELTRGGPGA